MADKGSKFKIVIEGEDIFDPVEKGAFNVWLEGEVQTFSRRLREHRNVRVTSGEFTSDSFDKPISLEVDEGSDRPVEGNLSRNDDGDVVRADGEVVVSSKKDTKEK